MLRFVCDFTCRLATATQQRNAPRNLSTRPDMFARRDGGPLCDEGLQSWTRRSVLEPGRANKLKHTFVVASAAIPQ